MSVGVGQSFLGIAGYITVVRDVEGAAALSHRWILHALHDMRRFLGRPDHGHDDTVRTDVQHASNMVVGVRRRANHDWEAACAKAEPNLGELWNSTRKQLPHRRLPYDKVLKVAVQAILVSGSISNSK